MPGPPSSRALPRIPSDAYDYASHGGPALLLILALCPQSWPETIRVPADAPTIQAAIDVAQPYDTVLVAPGTYVETIDFLGKRITVRSEAGPALTVIDGKDGSFAPTV